MIHLNPTGGVVRVDPEWGDGHFGARRSKWVIKNGKREKKIYWHTGCDFTLPLGVGQAVWAPIKGEIFRLMQCYNDTPFYRGVVIRNNYWEWRLLYIAPAVVKDDVVDSGQLIGFAQDVSLRYPPMEGQKPMTPHVHAEARKMSELNYDILADPWELVAA